MCCELIILVGFVMCVGASQPPAGEAQGLAESQLLARDHHHPQQGGGPPATHELQEEDCQQGGDI